MSPRKAGLTEVSTEETLEALGVEPIIAPKMPDHDKFAEILERLDRVLPPLDAPRPAPAPASEEQPTVVCFYPPTRKSPRGTFLVGVEHGSRQGYYRVGETDYQSGRVSGPLTEKQIAEIVEAGLAHRLITVNAGPNGIGVDSELQAAARRLNAQPQSEPESTFSIRP